MKMIPQALGRTSSALRRLSLASHTEFFPAFCGTIGQIIHTQTHVPQELTLLCGGIIGSWTVQTIFRRAEEIGRHLKLLHDPSVSCWEIMDQACKEGKTTYPSSPYSFAGHHLKNPITSRLINAFKTALAQTTTSKKGIPGLETPQILEVGAGDGKLSGILEGESGEKILSSDMLPMQAIHSPHRQLNMKTLEGIPDRSMKVVVSSYAAEYAKPDSWNAIYRVLKSKGKLVALIHHKNSVLGQGSSLIRAGYALLYGVSEFFPFPPEAKLNALGALKLHNDLFTASYSNPKELEDELKKAGFGQIRIESLYEDAYLDGHKIPGPKRDQGWLVTATK